MSGDIINKVAKSGLITIDLSDFSKGIVIDEFDLKDFLFDGLVLKEKDFRKSLKEYDFNKHKNKAVAVFCSSQSIIPMWAYMLISSCLHDVCNKIYFGTKKTVLQKLMLEKINLLDASKYNNKKVIIKGCGTVPLSQDLYLEITKKLQPNVDSLMFGEACSAVPVYKKRKNESKNY